MADPRRALVFAQENLVSRRNTSVAAVTAVMITLTVVGADAHDLLRPRDCMIVSLSVGPLR
jgi:hypothetical protein